MAHIYWDANDIGDGLEKCGPWFDCAIGTQGKYTSLNDAITAGHTRIAVLPGATITADLTITANNVWVVAFGCRESITLGGYKITVAGNFCRLAGFRINSAAAVGIEITGVLASLERINAGDCGSHGLYFNGLYGGHSVIGCRFDDNAGDGINMVAADGAGTIVTNCRITGNGAYGINDASNGAIMVGNRVTGNTTGQINSTSTYVAANRVA